MAARGVATLQALRAVCNALCELHLYANVLIPQQGGDAGDEVVGVLYAPAVRHHLVCTTSFCSLVAQRGSIYYFKIHKS